VGGVAGEERLGAVDVALARAGTKVAEGIARPRLLQGRQQVVQDPIRLERYRLVLHEKESRFRVRVRRVSW
jgi:hypothetical protein